MLTPNFSAWMTAANAHVVDPGPDAQVRGTRLPPAI